MRWLFALALFSPTGTHPVVERQGPEMVLVPAGEFTMGATPDGIARMVELCRRDAGAIRDVNLCQPTILDDQEPEMSVLLPAFEIDRFEVTNADYRACVRAGGCSAEPLLRTEERLAGPRQPVVNVSWEEAAAYCHFRGKRLPTEAEWEKAARGTAGRIWPWGNFWDGRATNHGHFDSVAVGVARDWSADESDGVALSAPVGSFPRDRSVYGAFDMAGNVSEWVDDWYGREPPQARARVSPRGPTTGASREYRGGSWIMPPYMSMATFRGLMQWPYRPFVGFRCARDAGNR
jgi:formylglycine-generating enzyme required for sulfatase activity